MNEDDLLEDLGALQRRLEQDRRAARLEAPLDQGFRDDLLQRLQQETGQGTDRQEATQGSKVRRRGGPRTPGSEAAEGPSGGTLARGRFGSSKWLAPLALAAGLALFLLPNAPSPPLPDYGLELRGQVRQQRSLDTPLPGGIPQLAPDSTVRLLLRPATSVEGAVEVRMMAESAAGGLQLPLPVEPQTTELGLLRLEATASELGLTTGIWTLTVAVARPEYLPDWQELPTAASDPYCRILRQRLEILPAAGGDG